MDRDTGIPCVRSHCGKMEQRGFPFAQYDADANVMKYMHFENGINEDFTKARGMLLSGELDADHDAVAAALQTKTSTS